jgi:hypothetical protein
MPDRPILIFPNPIAPVDRDKRGGGGRAFHKPSPSDQNQRLRGDLKKTADSFNTIAPSADGTDPSQVIVFEIAFEQADGLMKLADASSKIEGLEWLGEHDIGEQIRSGFGSTGNDPTPLRLYAFMANQQAMNRLLNLWDQWQNGDRAPNGYAPYWRLFEHLTNLRTWNARDRVDGTGLAEWWKERLAYTNEPVRFEAELWFRLQAEDQSAAENSLREVIADAGGGVLDTCRIEGIRYHGVLIECPASTVQDAFDRMQQQDYVQFLQCEDVRFFRGTGQSLIRTVDVSDSDERAPDGVQPIPDGEPLIALLDGLPLTQHSDLDERLILDDPDGVEANYPVAQRQHGTAMASLITRGDLKANESPSSRRLYVRPILVPNDDPNNPRETFPENRLFVDVIHSAIRRIVDEAAEDGAVAPSVRIVNLSIGNPYQPFVREMSPLARLIDWLSEKYGLLFIICAGNQTQNICCAETSAKDVQEAQDTEAITHIMNALNQDRPNRLLMAPAESLNALTVGAWHADASGENQVPHVPDLLRGENLPSPINPLASGFNRSVKPDIMMAGGRQHYSHRIGTDPAEFEINNALRLPGQTVAAPPATGSLFGNNRRIHCRGTSNAAALTSRLAEAIYGNLEARFIESGQSLDPRKLTVMTKALLVHGASWDSGRELLEPLVTEANGNWQHDRRSLAAWLGYGLVAPDRCLSSTDQRVLMVGSGSLNADEAHEFEVPIPGELSGNTSRRRVITTLAWLSPLNQTHRRYRRASLTLSKSLDVEKFIDGSKDVDPNLAQAGTVQHLIYETDRSVTIPDQRTMKIKVNCKPDAGKLESPVDYALAVTFEVAEAIDIFTPIQQRIQQRVAVQT